MSSCSSSSNQIIKPSEYEWYLSQEQDWPIMLSICGWSGSGKTWLIEKLIPILREKNLTVAVIKHDAHRLKFDHPQKDSSRFYSAGASYVMAHDPEHGFINFHKNDKFILGSVEK